MLDFPIIREKVALLLLDYQNDTRAAGGPMENPDSREILVPRAKKLAHFCRSKGIPVIFVCGVHRKDGSDAGIMAQIHAAVREKRAMVKGTKGAEVYWDMDLQDGDIVVEKHRYSAFYATDLEMILRNKGIDTVIISGGGINIGCETTARDATNRDFKVIFLSDGNLGHDMPDVGWGPIPKDVIQKVSLSNMAYGFAKVMSIDELIAKL